MENGNEASATADLTRRAVLAGGLGAVVGLMAASDARAEAAGPTSAIDPDEGVTAPEDLMREHGVLNRCLLIYEEGIRRLHDKEELTPQVFHHTASLIRLFVEEYHEKNEEKYIFSLFNTPQRAAQPGKLLRMARGIDIRDLVHTLTAQHGAGRALTGRILALSATPDLFHKPENQAQILDAATQFVRMYRPHENWEDTVIYPAIRTVLTANQVKQLGDRMEEDEHKVLGDEGFERSVVEVADIEKALGLYDLKQYTPKIVKVA